jgi:hypothetical protein
VRCRIVLIAFEALMPGTAALFFWVPMTGNQYLPAVLTWLLLAGTSVAWLKLAGRTWDESATLTQDLLVVRNVFRTQRLPLADVTGVRFRKGALVLSAAAPASPAGRRRAWITGQPGQAPQIP